MAKKKAKSPEPIVESLAIAVSPARAWEAITSPRILGDVVMGHVEIDPVPGKPFVWQWGVWMKSAPRADADAYTWRGQVLDAVPGSTLVLGGAGQSLAILTVKGEGDASLVTVAQGDVPKGYDFEAYRRGWADFLLKLKTLLERPPYQNEVFLRTLVNATPSQVIAAWLSPSAMSKLLPGKAKIQAKPGGAYEWQRKDRPGAKESGRFLEINKGHRISFTWGAGAKPREVRISAEKTPYGTLVSLEQIGTTSGFHEADRRMWAHLLERLQVYFYYGKKIRAS
jgi:uncharacterized protein YndB with AHSA1/START domain